MKRYLEATELLRRLSERPTNLVDLTPYGLAPCLILKEQVAGCGWILDAWWLPLGLECPWGANV